MTITGAFGVEGVASYVLEMIRKFFTAAFLICVIAVPASAGQIEDAVAALQKSDYATALRRRPTMNESRGVT